jgi:phosphopantothenoylcysteine decarboxylase/phosphopantothenate--cysteine ligase
MPGISGKEVLLGVSGGIAAYKSAELVRGLKAEGAAVTVVMTAAATRLVTPVTFQALTGRPVCTDLFELPAGAMSHIELTAKADIFIVAPATADIIGKMATGIADDPLSTMLMAAKCPVLVAPSMNCRMYENHALQRNIRQLVDFNVNIVGPEQGEMACNEFGWGRMSEPADIISAVRQVLDRSDELKGLKILVTAGPTYEDIDPVRFIGNRSSGRMGYAVAREAAAMGASVTLVSGPTSLMPPTGVLEMVKVRSASEMYEAVKDSSTASDIIIMAAAVADYTPLAPSGKKIKKGPDDIVLKLVKTVDILKKLGEEKKKGQYIVGFAAETEKLEANAVKKLKEKKLDLLAANLVGGQTGFESIYNRLMIFNRKGMVKDTGKVTKEKAARDLLDCIVNGLMTKEASV